MWEEIHWKEGINASPIIQYEEQQKAKDLEELIRNIEWKHNRVDLLHISVGITHRRDPMRNDQ